MQRTLILMKQESIFLCMQADIFCMYPTVTDVPRERAHKMGRLGMYICVTFTLALSYEKGVVTRGDIFVVC